MYIEDALSYNRRSGILRWKVDCCSGRGRIHIFAGTIAGSVYSHGGRLYRTIGFEGNKYRAHRVAWRLMKGVWPSHLIDHRDGNGLNNRWKNLRPATTTQNGYNRGTPRNNTSGYKGVRPFRKGFQARITANRRQFCLGTFKTAKAAYRAYIRAARKLHGEFVYG